MLLADANWLANQLTDANLVIFKYKVQIFLFNQLVRIRVRIHLMENKGFDDQNIVTTVIKSCSIGAFYPTWPGGC